MTVKLTDISYETSATKYLMHFKHITQLREIPVLLNSHADANKITCVLEKKEKPCI